MNKVIVIAFFIGVFVGTIVGIAVVGLCQAAKLGDEQIMQATNNKE